MHGVIHLELKKFVEHTYGADAWTAVAKSAGVAGQVYTPLQAYPDAEIVALVVAASELTKKPAAELLEAFGESLVPMYLSVYGGLLKPEWRTLDVIEHTEETIHRVVRRRQAGAAPPHLRVERVSPTEAVLTYDSARRLCAVARGIARGVARHFGELLHVTDRMCMLRGDSACVIVFRV